MTDDPALIVEGNMREDEKKKLSERILRANPRLQGANIADFISMATDTDSYSYVTEELWATMTDGEYDEPWKSTEPVDGLAERAEDDLYRHAMVAIAMIYGEAAMDYEPVAIRGILHRLTKTEG